MVLFRPRRWLHILCVCDEGAVRYRRQNVHGARVKVVNIVAPGVTVMSPSNFPSAGTQWVELSLHLPESLASLSPRRSPLSH